MFQRILVPLDGSPRAEQALPVAAWLARASGGSAVLLQVVTPPIDYGGGLAQAPLLTEQVIESELAKASSYLDQVAKSRELAEIKTTTDVVFGLPAPNILDAAMSNSADLIVNVQPRENRFHALGPGQRGAESRTAQPGAGAGPACR
jgi:nucleotide-binding universal stress UspA family protein